VAVKLSAEVRRQAVDVTAQIEQRIAGGLARKRPDRRSYRLRLGPAPLARESLEAFEVAFIQIHL